MKRKALNFIFMAILLVPSQHALGQERWWQRETLQPPQGQMVDLSYLSKKQELEITLNDMQDTMKQKSYYANLGQNTKEFDRWQEHLGKKMNVLEYELSRLPKYIAAANTPKASAGETINNTVNVTVNQPQQQQKSNAEILFSGAGNLASKIQLDELITYVNNKQLTIDQKITYFEAFILDWLNTAAAKEAEIRITEYKMEKINLEIEKARTIFKGNFQLEATNEQAGKKATPGSKTFVHPDDNSISVSFYVPIPADFDQEFQLGSRLRGGTTNSGAIVNFLQKQFYGNIEITYRNVTERVPVYGGDFKGFWLREWEYNGVTHFVVFSDYLEKTINTNNLSISIQIVLRSEILDRSRFSDGRWYNLNLYELENPDLIVLIKEIRRTDI